MFFYLIAFSSPSSASIFSWKAEMCFYHALDVKKENLWSSEHHWWTLWMIVFGCTWGTNSSQSFLNMKIFIFPTSLLCIQFFFHPFLSFSHPFHFSIISSLRLLLLLLLLPTFFFAFTQYQSTPLPNNLPWHAMFSFSYVFVLCYVRSNVQYSFFFPFCLFYFACLRTNSSWNSSNSKKFHSLIPFLLLLPVHISLCVPSIG